MLFSFSQKKLLSQNKPCMWLYLLEKNSRKVNISLMKYTKNWRTICDSFMMQLCLINIIDIFFFFCNRFYFILIFPQAAVKKVVFVWFLFSVVCTGSLMRYCRICLYSLVSMKKCLFSNLKSSEWKVNTLASNIAHDFL